jgi:YfiH family protein
VALSLRFADCTPIIVYDPAHHALGVAHAGWRGTVSKIAVALVEAMSDAFGSEPAALIAGIGPSIGPCCYEVGEEVIAAARTAFEREVERRDGWPLLFSDGAATYLDLWSANRVLLEWTGVRQIETARLCTACHRQRFFSHRAEAGKTGRFAMVAALRP